MNGQLQRLNNLLSAIRGGVSTKRGPSKSNWQNNAVTTVVGNVNAYKDEIRRASATGRRDDEIKAACRVSGIRKGVSDLGILDNNQDRALIDLIDEADMLATQICVHSD